MKVRDLLKVLHELPTEDLDAPVEIFANGNTYSIKYVEMMQSDSLHPSDYLSIGARFEN